MKRKNKNLRKKIQIIFRDVEEVLEAIEAAEVEEEEDIGGIMMNKEGLANRERIEEDFSLTNPKKK